MFIDRDVVRLLYNVFRTVHERQRFISFIIFFSLFIGVLFWVRAMRRDQVEHMSALPLADDCTTDTTNHAH